MKCLGWSTLYLSLGKKWWMRLCVLSFCIFGDFEKIKFSDGRSKQCEIVDYIRQFSLKWYVSMNSKCNKDKLNLVKNRWTLCNSHSSSLLVCPLLYSWLFQKLQKKSFFFLKISLLNKRYRNSKCNIDRL